MKRLSTQPLREITQRQQKQLLYAILVVVLVSTVVRLIYFLFSDTPERGLFSPVLGLLCFSLLWMVRRGHLQAASWGLVITLWMLITLSAATGYGVRDPAFRGYMGVILIAAVLLRATFTLGIMALTIVAGGLMVWGIDHAQSPSSADIWLVQSLTFIVSGGLMLWVLYGIRAALTELHQNERRFRLALDQFPGGVLIYDADLRFEYVNQYALKTANMPPEKFIGRTSEEVLPLNPARAKYFPLLHQARDTKQPQKIELDFETPGGTKTYFIQYVPFLDEHGAVQQVFCVNMDITELKQTQADLHKSNEMLRAIIEASPVAIYVLDREGKVTLWNEASEMLFGWRANEVVGKPLPIIRPERQATVRDLLQRNLAGEILINLEVSPVRKDGQVIHINLSAAPVYSPQGEVESIMLVAVEITQRKQAEAALFESNRLLNAIIEASPLAIYILDADGTVSLWNHAAEKMFLWEAGEVVGKPLPTSPADQTEELYHLQKRVLAGETLTEVEVLRQRKDGSSLQVSIAAAPIANREGRVDKIMVMATDITQRKQAEAEILLLNVALEQKVIERTAALEASETRYRGVVELQSEMVCRFLPDGTLTFVNQAYCDAFGKTREQLLGQTILALTPAERHQVIQAQIEVAIQQPGITHDNPYVNHLGELRWHRWSNQPIRDEQGEVIEIQGVGQDITQQKQADEAIHQLNEDLAHYAAQLEASNKELEAFTYSVSHDLRAPLRALSGFSGILLQDYAQQVPEQAQHYLKRIHENAKRMGMLVDDLLQLSRLGRQELRWQTLAPQQVVQAILDELQADDQLPQLEISLGDLPMCQADPVLLKQLYYNLITNAIKFTRGRDLPRLEIGSLIREDDCIYYVKDNGVGFDMQYVDKLFGVFQRLHNPREYEGTGIGLAIVQRIALRHGGRAWAEGVVDQGATFFFTLGQAVDHER